MELPKLPPKVRETLMATAAMVAAVTITLWRMAKPVLLAALKVLLALIVVFEEWGWEPLAALLARLARFRLWARAELWIAGLPPYGALCAFALPAVTLFPFKLVALWLLANGHFVAAGFVFVAAKVVGTAFLARIFMLTKPALMQIGWFARAYNRFMPWKEAAHAWLHESWAWRMGRIVKYRASRVAKSTWAGLRPRVLAAIQRWRPILRYARRQLRERWADLRRKLADAWSRLAGALRRWRRGWR